MSVSQVCLECKTLAAKVHCTGCDAHFCVKHFQQHRITLNDQIDQIIGERDSIKDQIEQHGFDTSTTEELLAEIAEWENEITTKIKEVADRARDEVNKLSSAYETQVRQGFEQFSIDLHDMKESENYDEPDLLKLQHSLEHFQKEVNKLSSFATVVIDKKHYDEIEWDALLGVRDLKKTNNAEKASTELPERVEPVVFKAQGKSYYQRESSRTNDEYSKDVENTERSKRLDIDITDRISDRNITTIQSGNDRNAGTVCCHDNQLIYVDYDETVKKSKIIFLNDIEQPNEKSTTDWVPVVTPWKPAADEEWIRDIIYCDRLKSYLLLTQNSIHQWYGDDEQFEEYYRSYNYQLKQMAADANFIYLVGKSNRFGTRRDSIILRSYEKIETTKAFTEIIANRSCNGSSDNYEIMDIAVAPHNVVMLTYQNESLIESGLFLFEIKQRDREWVFLKQLKLDFDSKESISFTPRVEWANKLSSFMLVEFNSGHLLFVNDDGEVKGKCEFQNPDDRSELPINVSISDNGWLCTRYKSAIVVKKIN